MKARRYILGSVVALIAVAFSFAAQPTMAANLTSELAKDSLLTELKKRKVVKVGFSTFVPWAMRDKKGDMIGYEIDVANKFGKDSGWEVVLMPMVWDGLIPALLAGKVDILIAGMNSTVKRAQTVSFSRMYEEGGANLVANKNTAGGRSSMEDFNTSDTIFAQRRGTHPVGQIKIHFPKAQIKQFDDENTVKQELLSGRSHVVWLSRPQFIHWSIDHPNELYIPMPGANLQKWISSMAMRQGDPVFLNYVNNFIIQNHVNGYMPERYQYWFGGKDWAKLVDK